LIDREKPAAMRKLVGQDPARNNLTAAWSPDGKKIVFASTPGKRPAKQKTAEKE
jgi:hypothetical protein